MKPEYVTSQIKTFSSHAQACAGLHKHITQGAKSAFIWGSCFFSCFMPRDWVEKLWQQNINLKYNFFSFLGKNISAILKFKQANTEFFQIHETLETSFQAKRGGNVLILLFFNKVLVFVCLKLLCQASTWMYIQTDGGCLGLLLI